MHDQLNLLEVPEPRDVLVATDEGVGELDEALDFGGVLDLQLPARGRQEVVKGQVGPRQVHLDEVLFDAGYADLEDQLAWNPKQHGKNSDINEHDWEIWPRNQKL